MSRFTAAVGVVGVVAVGVAVYQAELHAFVQDDAFITFRYARNLVEGHGLVYNPGERVEGFTNLLWLLLVAAGMALGHGPVAISHDLGLLCFGALVGCSVAFCGLLGHALGARRAVEALPVWLVLALPLNPSAAAYATGGLETSLFAALTLGAVTSATFAGAHRWGRLLTGGLLALLCATRPDGVVVVVVVVAVGAAATGWSGGAWRRWGLEVAALPVLAVLGLTLFRWAYFGDVVPNTFYAKSAHLPYPTRGLRYVAAFYIAYPTALAGRLAPIAVGLSVGPGPVRRAAALPLALLVSAGVAFDLWVVWVGGGFMEYKPLLHAFALTPVALTCSALVFAAAAPQWRGGLLVAALGVLVTTATRTPQVPHELSVLSVRTLSDQLGERYHWSRIGRVLEEVLPADTTIALGAAGAIPYYSRLPTLDTYGLTDRAIARQPLVERGVVGHEKHAGRRTLRERGVNLWLQECEQYRTAELPKAPHSPTLYIRFAEDRWVAAQILAMSRELLERVAEDDRLVVRRPRGPRANAASAAH